MDNPIIVSGVTYGAEVGKRFTLAKDGNLKTNTAVPGAGTALRMEFDNIADVWAWHDTLTSHHTLLAGNWSPEDHGNSVVTESALKLFEIGDAVARSSRLGFLAHRPGPAIATFDVDFKDVGVDCAALHPEPVRPQTPDEVHALLLEVAPLLDGTAMRISDSSSGMVNSKDGDVLRGPGGFHVTFPIDEGTQIPKLIQLVHDACWAKGIGHWAFVSKAGVVLYRSLADEALKKPSQPLFPERMLDDGLVDARRVEVYEGDILATAAVPPLTTEQSRAAVARRADVASVLKPEKTRVMVAVKAKKATALVERGVAPARAKHIAERMFERSILTGDLPVTLVGGEGEKVEVTVAGLVEGGSRYEGWTGLDPVEPDYRDGADVAIYYDNEGDGPTLFSQAHGGRSFLLRHDAESLGRVVDDEPVDATRVRRSFALALAGLLPSDRIRLLRRAARRLDLGQAYRVFERDVETLAREMAERRRDRAGEATEEAALPLLDAALADMNRTHGVIDQEGKVGIVRLIHRNDETSFSFSGKADMALLYDNHVARNEKDKWVKVFPSWLTWHDRRTYKGVVFEPDVTFADDTKGGLLDGDVLNLWGGYGVRPMEGPIDTFVNHVIHVWCSGNEGAAEGMLDRMAATVQFPGRVGLPMDVLIGPQGAGKSGILDAFWRPLLGRHYLSVDKAEHVLGRFTEHLRYNVVLMINEAVWGGDRRLAAAYKTLFTDDNRTLEIKYGPVLTMPNRTHGIMCSNELRVAPMGSQDRRHVVHDVSDKRVGDKRYFKSLFRYFANCGVAHMLHHLLAREVDFDALRVPPIKQSVLRAYNMLQSMPTPDRFLHELLDSAGDLEVPTRSAWMCSALRARVLNDREWTEGPATFDKQHLHDLYTVWCQAHDFGKPWVQSAFYQHLINTYGGDFIEESRPHTQPGKRRRVITLPGLDTARARFVAVHGMQPEWTGTE